MYIRLILIIELQSADLSTSNNYTDIANIANVFAILHCTRDVTTSSNDWNSMNSGNRECEFQHVRNGSMTKESTAGHDKTERRRRDRNAR